MNLVKNAKLAYALAYVSTSTGSTGCTVSDNQGFEGIMYVLQTGSSASTGITMHIESGSSSGCGDAQDLTGTSIISTSTGHTMIVADVYKPPYRYTWPIVSCDTESAYSILAIQYGARKLPVSQSADVTANELNIGSTGTA
jgi:hypothetical protein